MSWSWRGWTTVLLVGVGAVFGISQLSWSQREEPSIEGFSERQMHIRPARLAAGFKPAITEKIYVPLYSHIYQENSSLFAPLTGLLSIRNTDDANSLVLKSVAYYNTQGKLLQELCKEPLLLAPMATGEIVVPRRNAQGGSGASFIVEWMAGKPVSEPIVESVMISNGSAKDVSFVSRGVVVSRTEIVSGERRISK